MVVREGDVKRSSRGKGPVEDRQVLTARGRACANTGRLLWKPISDSPSLRNLVRRAGVHRHVSGDGAADFLKSEMLT